MWVRCQVSYLIFSVVRQSAITTSAISEKIDRKAK